MCCSLRWVFVGIEFPPEGFTEIFCLAADAFQIVEIGRRNLLKHHTEVRHGHRCEPVMRSCMIQVSEKEAHHLAPLREPLSPFGRRRRFLLEFWKEVTDGFHGEFIVPFFKYTKNWASISGCPFRYELMSVKKLHVLPKGHLKLEDFSNAGAEEILLFSDSFI